MDNGLVIGALLVWWLVGPVLWDDGWIVATVANFVPDRVFANYYEAYNASYPLGYVHFLAISGFAAISKSLLWLRLPSLLAGIATWFVTRSVVRSGVRCFGSQVSSLTVRMVTGLMFLISWISWNNTLRPEPFVALLVAVSLWASIRFLGGWDRRLLLLMAVAIALAASINPIGIVSLAAPIVAVPAWAMWLKKSRLPGLVAVGAAALVGVAILILAVWSMGDAHFWSASRQAFLLQEGHIYSWLDEPARYQDLLQTPESNPVRQLSVFLPIQVTIMFFLRRRRAWSIADIPALGYLAATFLLSFTPSKWIWHFGSLVPLAAAASGIEYQRWRAERTHVGGVPAAQIGVFLAGIILSAVAWGSGFGWNLFAVSDRAQIAIAVVSALLADVRIWLLGGIALVLAARATSIDGRASRRSVQSALTTLSASIGPSSAAVAVVIAVSAFAVDGFVLNQGWSLPRQNLQELFSSTCGLADEIMVPSAVGGSTTPHASSANIDSSSPSGYQSLRSFMDERGGTVLVAPQIRMYFPCSQQPVIQNGVAQLPRLILAVDGEPLTLQGSPHRGLEDVASSRVLSRISMPGNSQAIDVVMVFPNEDTADQP